MFVGYADPEWVWPQAVTLYTKNFDVIGFYRSHEENPLQHGMKVLCPPMGGELQSHVLWAWILYLFLNGGFSQSECRENCGRIRSLLPHDPTKGKK
ncbi:MAG: hypothetical protein GW875_12455 [Deltaproteobacteria bacterium]|nr:hypothetical protein [Deltaproteobacteria bacterium]